MYVRIYFSHTIISFVRIKLAPISVYNKNLLVLVSIGIAIRLTGNLSITTALLSMLSVQPIRTSQWVLASVLLGRLSFLRKSICVVCSLLYLTIWNMKALFIQRYYSTENWPFYMQKLAPKFIFHKQMACCSRLEETPIFFGQYTLLILRDCNLYISYL